MKARILVAVIIAAAMVTPFAGAQSQSQSQGPPPPKPAQPGQTQPPATTPATPAVPEAPAVNPIEEADYKTFFDLPKTDNAKVVETGEEFLKKHPESRYREAVYTKLVNCYLNLDQVDKLFVTGEKALQLNPDNADVLAMVAYAVPRRLGANDLDGPQKLTKAEAYGKKAIEVINAMPKPDALTEEDFTKAKADKLSMAHSGLGVVNYHRQKFADMATELETATKLSPSPDPVDFYLLGIAYQTLKRWPDAVTAYEKCSVTGPVADRCKSGAANAKKVAATAAPKQ